jgi:thioredoxin 1
MWAKFVKWLVILLPIGLMVLLYSQKGNLEAYVSRTIQSQNTDQTHDLLDKVIDSLFNYQKNEETYKATFLEFGANGCVACRKMEFVLDEVRDEHKNEVKVVFLNILQPQNQDLMKYYGVVSIPTQILLDKTGKEYFRHTGYIPYSDLSQKLKSK